jgi:integrase
MPSNPDRIPKYRHHRPSGQAVVTLDGKDQYLGVHGTPASREAYNRLIAEWLAGGRHLPQPETVLTMSEVILRYWRTVEDGMRVREGQRSPGELYNFRVALRMVRELYGRTPARDFGPLALKALRLRMIERGWCRTYINRQVNRVRRMIRWAVSEELLPAEAYHGLMAVEGLRRGKSKAREKAPVKPVPRALVDAVLPHLSPPVRAMVELQWLTGMRSGEVLRMRGCDLDVTGMLWIYRPAQHKTLHIGHNRAVYLGPKAQELLRPFLKRDLQAFLFSPAEAEALRNRERRKKRRTPLYPCRMKRKPKPKARRRPPGLVYDVDSYRRAIARACWKAKIASWHPHQLRHAAGTRLRKEFGLEEARAVLGHRTPIMTEHYAAIDEAVAARVMEKAG